MELAEIIALMRAMYRAGKIASTTITQVCDTIAADEIVKNDIANQLGLQEAASLRRDAAIAEAEQKGN